MNARTACSVSTACAADSLGELKDLEVLVCSERGLLKVSQLRLTLEEKVLTMVIYRRTELSYRTSKPHPLIALREQNEGLISRGFH